MKKYGLIGHPVAHSFSKQYFENKFHNENLVNCSYQLFDLPSIDKFPDIVASHPDLLGLNVTIPFKTSVIPYLDRLDQVSAKIEAVNVIKKTGRVLKGYNSDYYGFQQSLKNWIGADVGVNNALVLGTGGASKAIIAVLNDLNITYKQVTRSSGKQLMTYQQLNEDSSLIANHQLIVNCTPLGMGHLKAEAPDLPYELIGPNHFLYDLVYNPETSLFLKKGVENNAATKNGLEMLHLQAAKSWEIWNA